MPERRILIVEDDADIREELAEVMADAGAEVVVAANGAAALELLRDGPRPSVILLDMRLPRLGGDDFLRQMRADPRFEHTPVITMTAGTGAADATDVVALHRPIDVDGLRDIVLSLFDAAA